MPDLAVGAIFAGYRIEELAGRGGMGVVYRATQLALDRTVALKVITPEHAGLADFRARFERESRIAASLRHPHVIAIHDAQDRDGTLVLVMDYADGSDLREILRRDGALEPTRAARILLQVGSALDAAHARGLVHRDIKPANVLIERRDDTEHAYLTDFGVSKLSGTETGLTRPGGWVGTPDYLPPEQIRGEEVDGRADVYALGCLLFHVLTDRPPFDRPTEVAKLWAHMNDLPPSLSEVGRALPAALDDVIARALAKEPAERYGHAGELARAFAAATGEASSELRDRHTVVPGVIPPSPRETSPSPSPATEAEPARAASPSPSPATEGDRARATRPPAAERRPSHGEAAIERRRLPVPDSFRRRPRIVQAAALSVVLATVSAATWYLFREQRIQEPASGPPSASARLSARELQEHVGKGTVQVRARFAGDSLRGLGVIVDLDRGLVLTNSHVVAGSSSIEVLRRGATAGARIEANAPCDDLALLRLADKPSGLAELRIGDPQALGRGDRVTAFANRAPGSKGGSSGKIIPSRGAVLRTNVEKETDASLPRYPSLIEHDAAFQAGSSGGPLVDARGDLVGINTDTEAAGDGRPERTYYSISGRRVQELLPDLTAGKSSNDVGWALVAGTRSSIAETLGLDITPHDGGLVVLSATTASAADRAGISQEDVIVEMRGEPVESVADVCRVLQSAVSGETVPVIAVSSRRPNGVERDLRLP